MSTNTINLHCVLRAPAERVYRAFLDGDAMAKWLPPFGFVGTMHHMEAKVNGSYRMSFKNFTTGKVHSFGGSFVELIPNHYICYTDKFESPHLSGEMTTKITLKESSCATDLTIVQEGVPAMIPAASCYLGWQDSLRQLAQLVEAQIADDI